MILLLFIFTHVQSGGFDLEPNSGETRRQVHFLENERADQTRFALANAERYVVRFREIFKEESVPQDLLWLALIETSFRTSPTSVSGAQGMFQFKAETARFFGLKVNRRVDERNNPYLAARAAARYLFYLHEKFKDWDLVLAAYNLGEGDLRRTMKRRKLTTWIQVRPFVREETQNYVGKVKAAAIIGNRHMTSLPAQKPSGRHRYHRVQKNDTLYALAREYKVSLTALKELNGLSVNKISPGQLLMIPKPEENNGTFYTVKKGDTLYRIANRFKIPVETLVKANRLKSNQIYPGQILIVPVKSQNQ